MKKTSKATDNQKIIAKLNSFDDQEILRLLDLGVLKISPMRITNRILVDNNSERLKKMVDCGLLEVLPEKNLNRKMNFDDQLILLGYQIKDIENSLEDVINCPITEEAWGKLLSQTSSIHDQYLKMQKIRRKMKERVVYIQDVLDGKIPENGAD